ncbi:MAG: LamG domain-containing protein, partial [Kiritimatiellales bacterium]|nr:LamG domain-containing protein [Kiritimatiellales bacterium]
TTTTSAGAIAGWGTKGEGGKWSFTLNATGRIRQEVASGYTIGTAVVNDGDWHHVALSFPGGDITNAQIYVDGSPDPTSSSSAQTVKTIDSGPAMIGVDNQNRYFMGDIDELRIYDLALSHAEIAAVYSATNQSAAAWARRYFGNATVDWGSDDDNDNGRLLAEYALGGQPWMPDAKAMCIQSDIQTDRLHIRYPRRITGTHNLSYTVEVSSDLDTWSTLTPDQVSTVADLDNRGFEDVEIELDPPFGDDFRFFIRLHIAVQ